MKGFFAGVIKKRKIIFFVFLAAAVICAGCQQLISVNYDMNDYLPEDTASTVALNTMEEEFDGGIPKTRVMIYDVTVPEALEYKEKLSEIDGVTDVTWLDDAVDLTQPLETLDTDTIEDYYKDGTALFSVTVNEEDVLQAEADIRELIGDENAMTGADVSKAIATESTISEIRLIAIIAVAFVLFVLAMTTTSWAESVIVLVGLGVAVLINAGSNLIFGEISFVTNAAGNILQIAVSLDYSVFLIHRFEECRQEESDPKKAMESALKKSVTSILSSGLTTVIGFLALVLMRFQIGADLGLALAKGIAISLITVFIFMPGFILLTYKWMDKTKHKSLMPEMKGFGRVVSRITLPLCIVFALLIVPSFLASNQNDYYYGSSHLFAEGTQLGDDTKAIEDIYGESDTYVLMVPKGDTATETEMLQEIKELPEVSSVIAFVEQAGAQVPYEYLDEDTLSQLESEHYSRMVLSVDVGYEGEETNVLVEKIRGIAQDYYPDTYLLAGEGVSTYDLMNTVTADMVKVNFIAIAAVFVVLLLSMRNLLLPVILVLTIETAVWINLSIPYYTGNTLFYIAYLIISSIQLGATVDYAILFTDRYRENRQTFGKKESIVQTISNVTVSVCTSGVVMTVVGFLLGIITTHELLSQLGFLLGQGTICSLICVLFVLPGLLYLFDGLFVKQKEPKTKKTRQLQGKTETDSRQAVL